MHCEREMAPPEMCVLIPRGKCGDRSELRPCRETVGGDGR